MDAGDTDDGDDEGGGADDDDDDDDDDGVAHQRYESFLTTGHFPSPD